MDIKWVVRPLITTVLAMAVTAALFGAGPMGAVTALADEAPGAYVNTGRLNVRQGPGVGYTVIARIDQWQTVTLLGRNAAANWVKIQLPGGTLGWVNAYYLKASIPIVNLPIAGAAPVPSPTGMVTTQKLELRAGPGAQYGVLAVLTQGQALVLLGRTTDTAWVKVSAAGKGDGWVAATCVVRVVGGESGVTTQTFHSDVSLSSLPVASAPTIAGPQVALSNSRVADGSPIYITLTGFPANRPVAAVLTTASVPIGTVVANGQTDASGSAQLFFRMPDVWPNGAHIAEHAMSLAVGTTDGAVLIWNGVWCD